MLIEFLINQKRNIAISESNHFCISYILLENSTQVVPLANPDFSGPDTFFCRLEQLFKEKTHFFVG